MCKSPMAAPRLANVLLVLLIANFSVALSSAIDDRAPLRSSSNFVAADPAIRENLVNLPTRWMLISSPELQQSEIEVPLVKRHVQKDKSPSEQNTSENKREGDVAKVPSVKEKPQSLYRTIFDLPRFCPPGQKMDRNGECRDIV